MISLWPSRGLWCTLRAWVNVWVCVCLVHVQSQSVSAWMSRARYYDDWEAITFIRSVKGKTCVSRGSERSSQIYRGKWHILFLTRSAKKWNGDRCRDKTHLWGMKAWVINLRLEAGERNQKPYNTAPSKKEENGFQLTLYNVVIYLDFMPVPLLSHVHREPTSFTANWAVWWISKLELS